MLPQRRNDRVTAETPPQRRRARVRESARRHLERASVPGRCRCHLTKVNVTRYQQQSFGAVLGQKVEQPAWKVGSMWGCC
jgi:hypothetical protein